MIKPAIGLIELSSIAKGLFVSDAMIKKAPVDVLMSQTTSPGKYLILISGDVASVQESIQHAKNLTKDVCIDHLFIPNIHPQIIPGIQNKFPKINLDAVGVLETQSVASTISGADQALKSANVNLINLKLGKGLGGKGYFVITGDLSEVEAAIGAAKNAIEEGAKFLNSEIIARPHSEFQIEVKL